MPPHVAIDVMDTRAATKRSRVFSSNMCWDGGGRSKLLRISDTFHHSLLAPRQRHPSVQLNYDPGCRNPAAFPLQGSGGPVLIFKGPPAISQSYDAVVFSAHPLTTASLSLHGSSFGLLQLIVSTFCNPYWLCRLADWRNQNKGRRRPAAR